MNRNRVMMNRNMILLATPMFLLNFVAGAAPIQSKELPPLVPGKLDWDYVGNSFSDFAVDAENGVGRWVQNFVDEIEVTPDGTVVVGCDWDEGGRCLGLYKDGGLAERPWAKTTARAVTGMADGAPAPQR